MYPTNGTHVMVKDLRVAKSQFGSYKSLDPLKLTA